MKRRHVDEQMLAALDSTGFDIEPLRAHLGRRIERASVVLGRPRWWVCVNGAMVMVTVTPKPPPAPAPTQPQKRVLRSVIFDSNDLRPPVDLTAHVTSIDGV